MRWARRAYPLQRDKIRLLMNGFPAELESAIQDAAHEHAPHEHAPHEHAVSRIVSMGLHAGPQRVLLGQAVLALRTPHPRLELRHVGNQEPADEELTRLLGDRASVTGQLPHAQAMQELQRADVLIAALKPSVASGSGLSSKLFEYLALGKPFIIINPTKADRILLRRYTGYRALTAPTLQELTEALQFVLSNAATPPIEQIEDARQRFSRRAQTRQLAHWLDELSPA
jgi:glycosyltransferase involved in cell wall biosynthesis